jgi:hypothetical protein
LLRYIDEVAAGLTSIAVRVAILQVRHITH